MAWMIYVVFVSPMVARLKEAEAVLMRANEMLAYSKLRTLEGSVQGGEFNF